MKLLVEITEKKKSYVLILEMLLLKFPFFFRSCIFLFKNHSSVFWFSETATSRWKFTWIFRLTFILVILEYIIFVTLENRCDKFCFTWMIAVSSSFYLFIFIFISCLIWGWYSMMYFKHIFVIYFIFSRNNFIWKEVVCGICV